MWDWFKRILGIQEEASYTVKSGDTLENVARELNVPIRDLVAANSGKIGPKGQLRAGDTLTYKTNYKYKGSNWTPSEETMASLKEAEGFSSKVYRDANGVKTVGYGFTDPKYLKMAPMSPHQADSIMSVDMVPKYVEDLVRNTPNWNSLTDNQKNALFHYMYNIGVSNYTIGSPNLQKGLEEEDDEKVVQNIDYGYNDRKNPGLRTRRDNERALYQKKKLGGSINYLDYFNNGTV